MRLSDLMKNNSTPDKGRPSGSVQPAEHVKKEVAPAAQKAERQAYPKDQNNGLPPVQKPPPHQSSSPLTRINNLDDVINKSNETASLYNSMPEAILRAAEQLEIPIPQNKDLTISNARIKLHDLLIQATTPDSNKDGLWEKTRHIANDLAMVLALDTNLARVIDRHGAREEQLASHCINTALIAMDLVKDINNAEFPPQEIGAASLLHDIGIVALDIDFMTDENDPLFKEHVNKGVELLTEMKVPESIMTMVAQHHERLDGTGYPNGISGREFLRSSQVLALSEGFERIMIHSNNAREEDEPQQNYVQATVAEFRKAFEPDILKAFISLRGFYPNGTMVELTNRSICLVVKQNEGFPLRPVVQIVIDSSGNHPDRAMIKDLRSTNTLSIVRAVTQGSH